MNSPVNIYLLESYFQNSGIITEILKIDDVEPTKISSSVRLSDERLIAIGCGCILSISRGYLGYPVNLVAELEFDEVIDALAWDPQGSCVLVSQKNGVVHFVTESGNLILSHRILSQMEESRFMCLQFLFSESSPNPSLVCITEAGLLIYVDKLPVQSICKLHAAQPQVIKAAASKLKFQRNRISLQHPIKKSKYFSTAVYGRGVFCRCVGLQPAPSCSKYSKSSKTTY